ncbi:JAB domain-containing protein [Pseudoxanthomonas putridarboris]|uniref:JAB domain-containing protein n=1 Tax=Pseudoxanthomonas putridarboris TaxID=752605 RepID=A0ABU9IVU6_9GAMM
MIVHRNVKWSSENSDTQHRLIAVERLFSDSVDGTEVCPRIVVQHALDLNVAAVTVVHNHPSGNGEPSA